MSSILSPNHYRFNSLVTNFAFDPNPRWLRSWSTSLHVFICELSRLSSFVLPSLDANQLALQAVAESHIARGYYPFVPVTQSPYRRHYGEYPNDGAAAVEIGFADGSPTPVLTSVPVHWTDVTTGLLVTIDGNAPLLAALRATSQDLVWVAAKWNPVDFIDYAKQRQKTIPPWVIDPDSAYP